MERCQDRGRDIPPDRARLRRVLSRPLQPGRPGPLRDLVGDRDRIGDHDPAPGPGKFTRDVRRELSDVIDLRINPGPRCSQVERRESIRAESDHRHSQRLECLARRLHIQDRFDAAGHNCDGKARKRREVCAHIQPRPVPLVNAPDTPGGEDLHPRVRRQFHRGAHRRCRVLAPMHQHAQVRGVGLRHVPRPDQRAKFLVRHAHRRLPRNHTHQRRERPLRADDLRQLAPKHRPPIPGHAMDEQRGLKGHSSLHRLRNSAQNLHALYSGRPGAPRRPRPARE